MEIVAFVVIAGLIGWWFYRNIDGKKSLDNTQNSSLFGAERFSKTDTVAEVKPEPAPVAEVKPEPAPVAEVKPEPAPVAEGKAAMKAKKSSAPKKPVAKAPAPKKPAPSKTVVKPRAKKTPSK